METFVSLFEWRRREKGEGGTKPLTLWAVRCPTVTSGHYKSRLVGIQHFLILATAPFWAKRNQHVLFSLKTIKVTSKGNKENQLNRGESISGIYLDSQYQASNLRTYQIAGSRCQQVLTCSLFYFSYRDMKLQQSFTLKPHLCSQPLLLTLTPKVITFSYYYFLIWATAWHCTGPA